MGVAPLATLNGVGLAQETLLRDSETGSFGRGMTEAVLGATAGLRLPHEAIDTLYSDINGERYRNEEWGFVCLRLSQYFDDPTAYRSPAECWGDMGAASGPLLAMLVCQAYERGYSQGPRAMLWASSEGGRRGAAVLAASGLIF